ncbi:von Willebrand factor A domain-containing protein 7-like [Corythoichthys intestinalis]|uniref:von Willebrand factor A domain-containing protein 7-like n=1 Tax=Corythoichthys intestinalis TaxID=161448 RepID=UPI0025A51F20|nr:von Willebrand factor A domain-containing protein 7-like [Corythoichthys intestinalis]XP_061791468.1 von Willebrand factor A domain-containing protein 7-like [Nerophis lumbriciformis]
MATTRWSFLLFVVLNLIVQTQNFHPLYKRNSITHREITTKAVLRKTAEVCRDIAAAEGQDFILTIDDSLTAEQVQKACSSSRKSGSLSSSFSFHGSIAFMYLGNAYVDLAYALSTKHHFDSETFQQGRDLITEGVSVVKASVKQKSYITGRATLGQLFHTIQDFYSHSNWVELENTVPYDALIKPDKPLENLAGLIVPTCRNCEGDNCDDNILPNVLKKKVLTSGYFGIFKPGGKCSHGGKADVSSLQEPVGGINKDTVSSHHGSLHIQAANLAVIATMDVLEDIRLAVGDRNFLQLMGLSHSSVLCFVIDTTGSMVDDITEAKAVAFDIIDSKIGTPQEPAAYILVPFNDPEVGPLLYTEDADIFKVEIDKLTAFGGGDLPEMCLTGLQLALTAAPVSSEIFVFTDAPAKDAHLKTTIDALIENTKSVVTFILTNVLASRHKQSLQDASPRWLGQTEAQLFRDIAQASGGQTIEADKGDLGLATIVIEDSITSALVTVFQAARDPGEPACFTFDVDASLTNITIYIMGTSSLTFDITSSTGVSQNSSEQRGPLATLNMVGNLWRLKLNNVNETGSWEISVDSSDAYSVKVTGQSPVNFIYNLVEAREGIHGDFFLKEGRPLFGGNVTLLVTVMGSEGVNVSEVTLCDRSSPTEVNGTLQSLGGPNFLVTFNVSPTDDFVVRLRGDDTSSSSLSSTTSRFQRQASTSIKTSNFSITARANSTNIEPGSTIPIQFTVTSSKVVTFYVNATNDRNFTSTSPSTVTIEAATGGEADGTVTLKAPDRATSGTDVTLTIQVEDATATDINYVVLRFSVTAKVTDVNRPVCHEVSTSTSNCSISSLCDSSQWEFVANVTDGVNGTGIERITVREGNGTLHTTTVNGPVGDNITVVSYRASCCADRLELSVVDNVGNVGICVGLVSHSTTVEPVVGTPVGTPATVTTNSTSTAEQSLSTTLWVWITIVTLTL